MLLLGILMEGQLSRVLQVSVGFLRTLECRFVGLVIVHSIFVPTSIDNSLEKGNRSRRRHSKRLLHCNLIS